MADSQHKSTARSTVFCATNPYKEMNPIRHLEKRTMDKIIGFLQAEEDTSMSMNGKQRFGKAKGSACNSPDARRRPVIIDCNSQSYVYNKMDVENEGSSYRPTKRTFEAKRQEQLYGENNVTSLPSQERSLQPKRTKGLGECNQGRNNESHLVSMCYPSSVRDRSSKRMFGDVQTNKETITTEMINRIDQEQERRNDSNNSRVSQRKQHVGQRKSSVGDCFNDFAVVPQVSLYYLQQQKQCNSNGRNSITNQMSIIEKKRTDRCSVVTTAVKETGKSRDKSTCRPQQHQQQQQPQQQKLNYNSSKQEAFAQPARREQRTPPPTAATNDNARLQARRQSLHIYTTTPFMSLR